MVHLQVLLLVQVPAVLLPALLLMPVLLLLMVDGREKQRGKARSAPGISSTSSSSSSSSRSSRRRGSSGNSVPPLLPSLPFSALRPPHVLLHIPPSTHPISFTQPHTKPPLILLLFNPLYPILSPTRT